MMPPATRTRSANSASNASERAAANTRAPRRAAASAKARPMPCEAPVITMRKPFRLRRRPMSRCPLGNILTANQLCHRNDDDAKYAKGRRAKIPAKNDKDREYISLGCAHSDAWVSDASQKRRQEAKGLGWRFLRSPQCAPVPASRDCRPTGRQPPFCPPIVLASETPPQSRRPPRLRPE